MWCYDRSAAHVSLLAMSCIVETTMFLRGFGVAGVVAWSLGDACFGVSNGVFSLKLQRICVGLVLLVWCYDRSAMYVYPPWGTGWGGRANNVNSTRTGRGDRGESASD